MLRLAEIALLLAPVGVVALWRLLAPDGRVPPLVLGTAAAVLVVMAGLLYWLADTDRLGPGNYVPAEWRDGRIVPGHAVPR